LNLEKYDLEDLLLSAIKSEVESSTLYLKIAKKTENGLLQDKLEFLAKEEDKHRLFVEDVYKNHFPEKEIKLPKETPVPLPEIEINEDMPVSKLLKSAMKSEKYAHDFYEMIFMNLYLNVLNQGPRFIIRCCILQIWKQDIIKF
jgi:rubrerythrin